LIHFYKRQETSSRPHVTAPAWEEHEPARQEIVGRDLAKQRAAAGAW